MGDVVRLLHHGNGAMGAVALRNCLVPIRVVTVSMVTRIVVVVTRGLVVRVVLHGRLGKPILIVAVGRGGR